MINMNAQDVVVKLYQTFEPLLPRVTGDYNGNSYMSWQATALAVALDVRHSHYGYGKDGNHEHGYGARHFNEIHHFIMCPKVHVWHASHTEIYPHKVPIDVFTNPSNHDSCWPDGINRALVDAYLRATDYCTGHLPQEMRDSIPTRSLVHQYVSLGYMGQGIKLVDIEWISDQDHDYQYKLLSVEPSKYTIACVEY